jgi:hypothetical protein
VAVAWDVEPEAAGSPTQGEEVEVVAVHRVLRVEKTAVEARPMALRTATAD